MTSREHVKSEKNAPGGGAGDRRGTGDTRGHTQLFWKLMFGAIRTISGVAAGVAATDAVNVSQLTAAAGAPWELDALEAGRIEWIRNAFSA